MFWFEFSLNELTLWLLTVEPRAERSQWNRQDTTTSAQTSVAPALSVRGRLSIKICFFLRGLVPSDDNQLVEAAIANISYIMTPVLLPSDKLVLRCVVCHS